MPNWCSNNLHMEGDAEEIKRFEDTHNSVPKTWGEDKPAEYKTKLDFSASVWDEDNDFLEYSTHGYNWQIKHWGTKWNACDVEHPDSGLYSFETAWGPAEAWMVTMSEQYPKLKFVLSYSELGTGFMGITVAKGGNKLFDKCIDLDEARDIIKQNLDPEEEKELKDLEEDDRWDFYDENLHKAWEVLEDEAGVN
jgi:hypothetical protein